MKPRSPGKPSWRPSRAFVILATALIVGAGALYVGVIWAGPRLVAGAFLRAQQQGDNGRAFRLLSQDAQARVQGPQMLDEHEMLYIGGMRRGDRVTLIRVRSDGANATATFALRKGSGKLVRTDELQLGREGVKWRVDFVP